MTTLQTIGLVIILTVLLGFFAVIFAKFLIDFWPWKKD